MRYPRLVGLLRGLFRFRLLTLLVAITLLSVFFAIAFHREPITRENLRELRSLGSIQDDFWKIRFTEDGSRIAIVQWEKPVQIREGKTLMPIQTIAEDRKPIDFAFSKNPNVVGLNMKSPIVEIHFLDSKRIIKLDTGEYQTRVEFSPDGSLIATGGYSMGAQLWRVADGTLLRTFPGYGNGALTTRFSPDGKIIAIGNRNSYTTICDVETGERIAQLEKAQTQGLSFDPKGESLAVAYCDGSIAIWDAKTWKIQPKSRQTTKRYTTSSGLPKGTFSPPRADSEASSFGTRSTSQRSTRSRLPNG